MDRNSRSPRHPKSSLGGGRVRAASRLRLPAEAVREEWILSEEKVPESRPHDRAAEAVFAQLDAMVKRTRKDAVVCRNLAVRWDEDHPTLGVDPDVCLLDPAPPEREEIESLRLWEKGHFAPRVAVEIVSAGRPGKDYSQSPEKYAENETVELWVFDPKLIGPKSNGGPFRIQVWRRDSDGELWRAYAGNGPAWSNALGAWVHAVLGGHMLRIANDKAGTSWWLTREEEERIEKERAQRRADRLAAKLREMGVDPGAE